VSNHHTIFYLQFVSQLMPFGVMLFIACYERDSTVFSKYLFTGLKAGNQRFRGYRSQAKAIDFQDLVPDINTS